MRLGLVAGSGRFPILALEAARSLGEELVVIAVREEASPEVESLAQRCYWVSLGQLGKLLEIVRQEQLTHLIFAGQVKHTRLFSDIKPDWRMARLLASLPSRNTDALIGGIAKVLEAHGVQLVDSTFFLKPLLADPGVMTRRKPTREERTDIDYGRKIANALAALDIGQSVAIAERSCVAVEAMEGTDAMLRRAAQLVNGRPLRLVKVSRRRAHLLFDVPVTGPETIRVMIETGTTALAVDAGRTLMLDKAEMIQAADRAGITIVGYPPEPDES